MPPAKRWDERGIVEAFRSWNTTHGTPPRRHDWNRAGPNHPSGTAVYRTFGSWGAAQRAAGFDPPDPGPAQRAGGWDRDSVVEAILDWVERYGQPPRVMDWSPSLARRHGYDEIANRFEDQRPQYLVASRATRLFGTWNAALAAAGQPTTQTGLRRTTARPRNAAAASHTRAWTVEDCVSAIQAHADEHGRPPTYDEWAVSDPQGRRPTSATVFQRSGSWRAGIIASGHTPRAYRRSS